MKATKRHSEPSAEALAEMPEMNFARAVRSNPYAARIAKDQEKRKP